MKPIDDESLSKLGTKIGLLPCSPQGGLWKNSWRGRRRSPPWGGSPGREQERRCNDDDDNDVREKEMVTMLIMIMKMIKMEILEMGSMMKRKKRKKKKEEEQEEEGKGLGSTARKKRKAPSYAPFECLNEARTSSSYGLQYRSSYWNQGTSGHACFTGSTRDQCLRHYS